MDEQKAPMESPPKAPYEFPTDLLLLLISQGKYDEAHGLIDRAAERYEWENAQERDRREALPDPTPTTEFGI